MSKETSRLSQVGAEIARKQAADKAAAEAARDQEQRRRVIAEDGLRELKPLLQELLDRAKGEAGPAAEVISGGKGVRLGNGELHCKLVFPSLAGGAFPRSRFTAVAGAFVGVAQTGNRYCSGRSSNLWYADLDGSGQFRWWEAAYMQHPLSRQARRSDEPFGVSDQSELEVADVSASTGMDAWQYGRKPTPIDGERREVFLLGWINLFAAAATGSMDLPRNLPEE
jgi:hypothetical protein